MVIPLPLAIKYRWVVRLGLMGYAATTIIGWAIQGPYYTTAYIAKGIEVALIACSRSTSPAWTATRSRSSERDRRPPGEVRPPLGDQLVERLTFTGPSTSPSHHGEPTDMKRLILSLGLVVLAAVTVACSGSATQAPASSGPSTRTPRSSRPRTWRSRRRRSTVTANKAFSLTFDNKDGAPAQRRDLHRQQRVARRSRVGEIVSSSKATQQVAGARSPGRTSSGATSNHDMTGRSTPSTA
jgi:hypothetical protein